MRYYLAIDGLLDIALWFVTVVIMVVKGRFFSLVTKFVLHEARKRRRKQSHVVGTCDLMCVPNESPFMPQISGFITAFLQDLLD